MSIYQRFYFYFVVWTVFWSVLLLRCTFREKQSTNKISSFPLCCICVPGVSITYSSLEGLLRSGSWKSQRHVECWHLASTNRSAWLSIWAVLCNHPLAYHHSLVWAPEKLKATWSRLLGKKRKTQNAAVFAFEVLRIKKQQTAVFLEENQRYNTWTSLGAYWNTYQLKTGYFPQALEEHKRQKWL